MSGTLPEKEQEEVLSILVEAHKNAARDKREAFLMEITDETNYAIVKHPGLQGRQVEIYEGDINTLRRSGLIAVSARQLK